MSLSQGSMLIGAGEVGRDGLAPVSSDDLARNRNRNLIPRFFSKFEKRADNTFIEKEYLELLVPGDPKSSPIHLVDERLIERFPENYQAFKEGRTLPTDGTPIESWLGSSNESLILMLKSMHLRTVENVAEMTDTTVAQIGMGGGDLRLRAQKFLEVQKGATTADALVEARSEIEELKARLAALEKGHDDEDEEVEVETPETKIELKCVKKNKSNPKKSLWAVLIDGIMDGDPTSEAEAKKRYLELKAENDQ